MGQIQSTLLDSHMDVPPHAQLKKVEDLQGKAKFWMVWMFWAYWFKGNYVNNSKQQQTFLFEKIEKRWDMLNFFKAVIIVVKLDSM